MPGLTGANQVSPSGMEKIYTTTLTGADDTITFENVAKKITIINESTGYSITVRLPSHLTEVFTLWYMSTIVLTGGVGWIVVNGTAGQIVKVITIE